MVATSIFARCKAILSELNTALEWHLDDAIQSKYLLELAGFVPNDCSDSLLRWIIQHYHRDHEEVAALRYAEHSEHDRVWNSWMRQVLAILYQKGLTQSRDGIHDQDDFAQIARLELVQSLPNFAYRSSFATWAYMVVVQSVFRAIRDSQAQKRRVLPESLESFGELDAPAGEHDSPESAAAARILYDHILVILAAHHNPRLATIFGLSAVEDMRTSDIAKLMHLHPSRIRALLAEARTMLQASPELQSWQQESTEAEAKEINRSP